MLFRSSDNWSSDCLVAWTWKDSAGRIVLCIVNLADHEAQGTILIPDWLRAGAERSWVNRWTGDDFQMPTEDWGRGAWTLYAQPSQVFVVESK